MNHQGGIRTASHAFAYYVLAKIYRDTDRKTDAETLLPDFQRLCSDIMSKGTVDMALRARAFSLLGYAYLAVNNYSKAGQAFDKAAHLVDGYTLAEVNRNLCYALRTCIQPLSTLESQTVSDTEATQFKGVESRNTASGKRQSTSQQPVSTEPTADTLAENTETGNTVPSSVDTDSTTEPAEHGETRNTAHVFLDVDFHDWTAGVWLLQLSFVLEQFLPQRHVRHSVLAAAMECIDAALSRHCANLRDVKLEPVGSFYDLLQTPMFHHVSHQNPSGDYVNDVLHQRLHLMAVHMHQSIIREGCETDDSFGVIEADDTHVGYIRIRLLHPPVCANKVHTSDTAGVYLSSTETTREFKKETLSYVTRDIAEVLHRGPAVTPNDVEHTKWNSVDVDAVFSLVCPEWPYEADHWSTRQRPSGWPSEQLIQSIIAGGCHVVPTSHPKSRNPDVEWRYSFSVAERTLA